MTRLKNVLAPVIVLFALAIYSIVIHDIESMPLLSDFSKFYVSAEFMLEGKDIYSPVPIDHFGPVTERQRLSRTTLHPNLNPPFQTLLLSPLALLSYGQALRMWSYFSLLAGLTGVFIFTRTLPGKRTERTRRFFTLSCLLLISTPTLVSVVYGQFSLLLLMLLAIAWFNARRGHDAIAGIALGLALSLKLFVGLYLVLFLALRRWRLLAGFIGTFLLSLAISLAALGPAPHFEYLEILHEVTWFSANWNASLTGFLSRIFGGSENTPMINLPLLSHTLAYGFSALATAGLYYLGLRERDLESGQQQNTMLFDLLFALSTVFMLLLSPLGWMYYFPLLMFALVAVWHASTVRSISKTTKIWLILALFMANYPQALIPAKEMNSPSTWFGEPAFYFYALLIFAAVLTSLALQVARQSPDTDRIP